jgi:hypothetical protein
MSAFAARDKEGTIGRLPLPQSSPRSLSSALGRILFTPPLLPIPLHSQAPPQTPITPSPSTPFIPPLRPLPR